MLRILSLSDLSGSICIGDYSLVSAKEESESSWGNSRRGAKTERRAAPKEKKKGLWRFSPLHS